MSLFAEVETLCKREHNSCKRKAKCQRHEAERSDLLWEAEYWNNFGRFCEHFIPTPKPKVKPHATTKADKDS